MASKPAMNTAGARRAQTAMTASGGCRDVFRAQSGADHGILGRAWK